jgi:hypothetical protein
VSETAGRESDEDDRRGHHQTAPNPTQERIDREGADDGPADVSWREDDWGATERDGD